MADFQSLLKDILTLITSIVHCFSGKLYLNVSLEIIGEGKAKPLAPNPNFLQPCLREFGHYKEEEVIHNLP